MPENVTLTTVLKNKSSQTLLDFLCGRFHYHTRSEWAERVADGRVTVNERAASDGQPLHAGDAITYVTTPWPEPEVNRDYRVVFEDAALFVVSKPAPLPVHAVGAYFQNTLMTLLRKDIPEAKDYQLVHRLDAETSGLLLLVKDKSLVRPFQKMWRNFDPSFPSPLDVSAVGAGHVSHEASQAKRDAPPEGAVTSVRKTYRAIVFGKFPPGRQIVDAPIRINRESSVRMKLAVVPHFEKGGSGGILVEGKPSVTEFELRETKGNFSLVEARPLTGRTHQIRVHLEHLGFPIVGDKLYSGSDETFLHFYEHGWDGWLRERVLLPRLALHAYQLEFTHPVTGKKMLFTDPLPEDLMTFWNSL